MKLVPHSSDRLAYRLGLDPLKANSFVATLMSKARKLSAEEVMQNVNVSYYDKSRVYYLSEHPLKSEPVIIIAKDDYIITFITEDLVRFCPQKNLRKIPKRHKTYINYDGEKIVI